MRDIAILVTSLRQIAEDYDSRRDVGFDLQADSTKRGRNAEFPESLVQEKGVWLRRRLDIQSRTAALPRSPLLRIRNLWPAVLWNRRPYIVRRSRRLAQSSHQVMGDQMRLTDQSEPSLGYRVPAFA